MVGESGLAWSVLGSGSGGNSVWIGGGGSCVLVDAGLNVRTTLARLDALGLAAPRLDAILLTHEHGDHVAHASALAKRLGAPLCGTAGTFTAAARFLKGGEERIVIEPGRVFQAGALSIEPVRKPHDASDAVAFVVRHQDESVGVFTDVGHVDAAVGEALGRCTSLVMESNHDPAMLANGPYPPSLRARVGGRLGHLSNDDASRALARHLRGRLRALVLGHVSTRNNTPALVRAASRRFLGEAPGFPRWLSSQDRPTPLLSGLGALLRATTAPSGASTTAPADSAAAASGAAAV